MLASALLFALSAPIVAPTPAPEPDPLLRAANQEFDVLATALETSARDGIVGADDLWLRAAEIRLGLGQLRRADADLQAREHAHRGDPARIAALFWSRRTLLTTDDERLAHAERFLENHARHARRDHRVLAEATVGIALWLRACDKGGGELGCLSVTLRAAQYADHSDRHRRLPTPLKKIKPSTIPKQYRWISKHCSAIDAGVITVYPLNTSIAARAEQHLARALQLASGAELPPDTRDEVADVLALVALYRLDPQLWSLLSLKMPSGLRFAPDPWADDRTRAQQAREVAPSRLKHLEFLRALERQSAALRELYAALARDEAAARLPALHLRLGLLESFVASELGRQSIPAGQATEIDALTFCATFHPQVLAAEAATEQAWARCMTAGTQHTHDLAAEYCETLLTPRASQRWPANAEFFAPPDPTLAWLVVHGVQLAAP